MKNCLLLLSISFSFALNAQVGIGTSSPDASAVLEVNSTNKGFLPPRLTFAQRKAISNPETGLMVYCTDCCEENGGLSFYKATYWETFGLSGCTYIDADGDGIENALDVDDDNDGILDVNEPSNSDLSSNASFETLLISIAANDYEVTDASNVPNWETTASDNKIEIWRNDFNGKSAYEGEYFVELNANEVASIYQDIATTGGYNLHWEVAHQGRSGVDSFSMNIGPTSGTVEVGRFGTGPSAWVVYSGDYIVPQGQTTTRLEFKSLFGGSSGNLIDDFKLTLQNLDVDGDGLNNSVDLDSDNDGIPDNVEAQTTAGYVAPGTSVEANGSVSVYGASGITSFPNNDVDNVPDFLDLDSDGDGTTDADESGFTATTVDTDKDGLHDNADTHPNEHYRDINGKAINASNVNILPDTGGTSEKDYRE